MAAFNKFDIFLENLSEKVHDLDLDVLKVYLSNTTPLVTNSVKLDIAEIAAGNGYVAGGSDATAATSRTGGTTSVTGVDIVWTASVGSIGPFRYAILYNDTPTSPADPLIGWWDYGSALTLNAGESFTVDFGTSMFTLA